MVTWDDLGMAAEVGTRIEVCGGYDFEPEWLGGRTEVAGVIAKWIPGQNSAPACVVPARAVNQQPASRQDQPSRRQKRVALVPASERLGDVTV
jgi:hypothetical protein